MYFELSKNVSMAGRNSIAKNKDSKSQIATLDNLQSTVYNETRYSNRQKRR